MDNKSKQPKKRVLYADPVCYGNHYSYNYNNIRILSRLCDLSLFVKEQYIDDNTLKLKDLFLWNKKYCWDNIPHKTRISYFVRTSHAFLHNLKQILSLAKKNKYDLVIISCVNITLLSLATRFTRRENIAFVDHGIYLSLTRKYVMQSWRFLNKRLKVCALESYFVPYLKQEMKIKNKIYLLKHPLNFGSVSRIQPKNKNGLLLFAPSSSNPISFALELKDNTSDIPDGIKIVCKGNFDYEDSKLLVYSGKLPREKYDAYFHYADGIIVPYDSNYNYRTSGVLFDSIVNKKPVILKKGNTLEYYSNKNPEIFYVYDCFDKLLDILNKMKVAQGNQLSFDKFLNEYGDDELAKEFVDLLEDKPL